MFVYLFNCKSNTSRMGYRFNRNSILSYIRRFVSQRGKPDSIISDNAPQFKLTSTVLSKQWRYVFVDKEVLNYVAAEGIKWSFTTALAPWQGIFMKG